MHITWSYAGHRVDGYEKLLGCYKDTEFDSPRRSTVPLLESWRNPDQRARELSEALNFPLSDRILLDFDHTVPVQRGRGKPSCTDLMLTSEEVSLAIEAKWTEPRYPDVDTWLREGSKPLNRIEVLEGWLDLLRLCSTNRLRIDDIRELPYQLVHRAASACYSDAKSRWLIYQLFDADSEKYETYLRDLRKLAVILAPGPSLRICAASYSIERTGQQVELERRWDARERHLHEPGRAGLRDGSLLTVQLEKAKIL